ncbi:MAG: ADP/ATP-dependent (S)-NAD(P)H-hydrate dehydratase, partial [Sphaerochaetaceae bacterium]
DYKELDKTYQAIAAGPGWSTDRDAQLIQLLKADIPMVLDADGINNLSTLIKEGRVDLSKKRELVITPHPGEFDRLAASLGLQVKTGESSVKEFIEILKEVANRLNSLLVYKSSVTWIVAPDDKPTVVEGLNNALAVAGSGDVLTGIIGSLLAQGYPLKEAAVNGVLIHKEAAVRAREALGWFDSSSLINYIGLVCREFEKGKV